MRLAEAKKILNNNGFIVEDATREGKNNIYTGLGYKSAYCNIISSALGQIYDGIGEGDDDESKEFQEKYCRLIDVYDVSFTNKDNEFVITCYMTDAEMDYIEYLVSNILYCILDVASIERKDKNVYNEDMYYEYLDANWKDIHELCNALTNIYKNGGKSKPWSKEQSIAYGIKIKQEKEKQEAEKEAKRQAKEKQQKQHQEAYEKTKNIIANYPVQSLDKQRADDAFEEAWRKESILTYFSLLNRQLRKIIDNEKYKRRIAAFYQKFFNLHEELELFNPSRSYKDIESTYSSHTDDLIWRFYNALKK